MRKFVILLLVIIFFALIAGVITSCGNPATATTQTKVEPLVKPEDEFTVISEAWVTSGRLTVGYFKINPHDTIFIIEGRSQSYPVSLSVK